MTGMISRLSADETFRRFVKFIIIGVLNTLFGYAVFALLVILNVPPQPALALAFVIGVIWNYWTHARLVFDQQGLSRLPAYAASYLLIYGLNSGGLALTLQAGSSPLMAQAVLAPVAAVISFFVISKVLTGKFPISCYKFRN